MGFDANRADLCIGVIGTGAMGRGIVQVAAAGGMHVLMMDTRAGAADVAGRRATRPSPRSRSRARRRWHVRPRLHRLRHHLGRHGGQ